jgi:glucose/arabinose dehydrogenase
MRSASPAVINVLTRCLLAATATALIGACGGATATQPSAAPRATAAPAVAQPAAPTQAPSAAQPDPTTPAASPQPTTAGAAEAPAATATSLDATPTSAPSVAQAQPEPTREPCPPPTGSGPETFREDICIRKVGEVGAGFVRLRRNPKTGELFALNTQAQIFKFAIDAAGNGTPALAYDSKEIGGGEFTLGMAFGPDGALYVVGNATKDKEGKCTLRKLAGAAWMTVAETAWYPLSNTSYDHKCNGVVVSPDNKFVFMNSGSRTEHGEVQENNTAFPGAREVPLTSALFRLPTDGRDIVLPADEAALKATGFFYADGLRNAFDLAFDAKGRLFGTENGPDADYPEELNELREGGHYGFPWRFGNQDNPQQLKDYNPATDRRLQSDFGGVQQGFYRNDPEFPPPPDTFIDPYVNMGPNANQIRDERGDLWAEPIHSFTAHRSPLGLTFDVDGALAGEFKNNGFVISWGSAAGNIPDRGEDLLQLQFTAPGQMRATQIVRGFQRPIDAVLIGKTMYVLENGGNGAVWEVRLP